MALIEFIELGAGAHQLDRIEHYLKHIIRNQGVIMQELEDLKQAVSDENTIIDSAVTLLTGIADQIGELPEDKVAIQNLANQVRGKTQALADAVAKNTPAGGATGAAGQTGGTGDTGSAGDSGDTNTGDQGTGTSGP